MIDSSRLSTALEYYEKMLLIRRVEERLLGLFSKGVLSGTTHTSIGQEACAVGVIAALDRSKDVVFSNHRCHGHFLAFTGDLKGLLGEVMGKATGVCGGVGGSQHLHKGNFYTNGIQGGIVPVATGIAFAEKVKGSGAIVVCFLGDGTMGQGVVYESLNMAALWNLPILYVLENNRYAQTTPVAMAHAGRFIDRPKAFGIEAVELDALDVFEINELARQLVEQTRRNCRPHFLILNTYRLGPHSKGDDFRPREEIEEFRARDPLGRLQRELPSDQLVIIERRITAQVESAVADALQSDSQTPEEFMAMAMAMATVVAGDECV